MRSFVVTMILFFHFQFEGMTQQSFEGIYQGQINGDLLKLQLEKSNQNTYKGKMEDSKQNYDVQAEANENILNGTATESNLGIVFKITGSWQDVNLKLNLSIDIDGNTHNMEVLFIKEESLTNNSNPKIQSDTKPTNVFQYPKEASHDPMLIGVWTKNENYNSGSGDNYIGASYSETIVLFENGSVGDGGSQATISGDNYLGQSESGFKALENVFWYNISNQIYVAAIQDGKSETKHLGRYYIENGNMLITSSNGSKMLLSRK